jgi:hypothetical protein
VQAWEDPGLAIEHARDAAKDAIAAAAPIEEAEPARAAVVWTK